MTSSLQILLIYFTSGLVIGAFSSFIAKEKNRNPVNWLVLGILFNIIAMLALVAVPPAKRNSATSKNTQENQTAQPPIKNIKAESVMRIILFVLGAILIVLIGYFNFIA